MSKTTRQAAYIARLADQGVIGVSFRLSAEARAALDILAEAHGSKNAAAEAALIQAVKLREYGLTDHQTAFLKGE